MDFGIVNVAAITVIAYLVGMVVRNTKIDNKWIPVVCGTVGGIFGIIALLIKMQDFPATDFINALAIGIVSGFAATGINQVVKQLNEKN